MKSIFSQLFGALLVIIILPAPAHSENPTKPETPQSFQNARKLAEPENEDFFRLGVGFQMTNLSAVFDINSTHSVQALFGIEGVKSSFDFIAGAIYRASIVGDRSLGFHLGGGITLGSTSGDFVGQVGPILGIHVAAFQLQQLQLSLDGGPILHFRQGNDLTVSALGNGVTGLSIHYFFK